MARISSLAAHTLLYVLNAASLASIIVTEARAGDPVIRFSLPSEPLPRALLDFYHQSGVQPGFSPTPRMQMTTSKPVSGLMASSVALARMLEGSGYTFRFDTDNSVDVFPREESSEAPAEASRTTAAASSLTSRASMTEAYEGQLEQVEVTGSLIHGVQDVVAPLVFLKQPQLAQVGYATVQDALYSLPIVSLNGPREDLGIDDNSQYGAGLDLRGLGVGATLVLVNGYRQPLSGLNGDFVDVSTIPWSAVDHIEVLPDGASALYGSDAIAGVVNLIMRDDFDGAETHLRYGTAIGGRREVLASQLIGTRWSSGHAMLAYQYSDTTPLDAAARPYAANADKTPYGGGNYDTYYSNPANILNPATLQPAYGVPAGQNGHDRAAAALASAINLQNPFAQEQLFPDVMAHEVYATATQDLDERLRLFFEGRFTARDALRSYFPNSQILVVPPSNPFYVNPFIGIPYTLVAYNFLHDYGPIIFAAKSRVYVGTAGLRIRLGGAWQATLSESYGRQSLRSDEYNVADPAALAVSLADPNPATAFDPFGAGSSTSAQTLAAIKRDYLTHAVSTIEYTRVVADGPLLDMAAGQARIAVGLERRDEGLSHDIADPLSPYEQSVPQSYARHIGSLFSQVAVPLAGDPANPRAVPRLELVGAGRYEHYSDFGSAFNPTVSIRWIPAESLKLRGSWGRSFRAPKLDDLYDTSNRLTASVVLPDPRSPTGRSLALVQQGSNRGLKQETAKTWTAGVDFAPPILPGSTFSLTYYSIDYRNRIAQPAADNPFAILVDESEWAAVITRNPSPAQVAALCNSADYRGSVSACLASSPAVIIDGRLANLARTHTTGLDLQAGGYLSGPWGSIDLGFTGNYMLKFDQYVTAGSRPADIVNTINNPQRLRLRGTIEWNREGPQLPGPGFSLAVNYTGGYENPGSTLVPDVSPWTTVDARVVYRIRPDAGWLSGTEFSVNVVNVFNHDPPFVDDEFGYDLYNVQPLGRVVSADVSKRW